MTQYSNFRLRAARDTAERPNGGVVQNRHKTAAASRAEPHFPAAGSAMTLTAALRIQQRTLLEIRPFEPLHL